MVTMYDITLTQLIFTEYAAIFSYLAAGAVLSSIFNMLASGQLHMVTQIHITLLWPWHLCTFAISTVHEICKVIVGSEEEEE